MTDWQIDDIYRGAVRRAEAMKSGSGSDDGGWKPPPEAVAAFFDPDRTDRETFIAGMEAQAAHGVATGQDFGALWDEVKAKKHANQSNGNGG